MSAATNTGAQPGTFLRSWLIASIAFAALLMAANALVDPYLIFDMPRIAGFNARKPAVETEERMMKAYHVLRGEPKALILGTSRVDMGLDAEHVAWPAAARPVYNLGLAAGDPFTSYRYLQHALSKHPLELVVLGLDFESYLQTATPRKGVQEFEQRLATDAQGNDNRERGWQRLRDAGRSVFSLNALTDVVATVRANLGAPSADLLPSGNLSDAAFRAELADVGSPRLFAQRNERNFRFYAKRELNPRSLEDLRLLVALCRERNVKLVLAINPVHADALEMYDLLGYWDAFERWKRELVAIAGENATAAIPLWDFADYDAYSTETVSAPGTTRLRWFWEPSHFTRELGDAVVSRLFSTSDTGYGVRLTPATIEAHLVDTRERQRLYRERQPHDAQRVRALAGGGEPLSARLAH